MSEPTRLTKNIHNRLEGILQMIIILEEDLEKQITVYNKKYSEKQTFMSGIQLQHRQRLFKAANIIREMRLDAQRMALQAGEDVAIWWAKRNKEVLDNEHKD